MIEKSVSTTGVWLALRARAPGRFGIDINTLILLVLTTNAAIFSIFAVKANEYT